MSSDDDFQPTLYNKRLRKRRKVDKTSKAKKTNELGSAQLDKRWAKGASSAEAKGSECGVSTRTRTKIRGKKTETRGKNAGALDCNKQETGVGGVTRTSMRVILQRLDVQPGTRYVVNTRQRAIRRLKQDVKGNKISCNDWPRRHHYKRSVLSLPHVQRMVKYSTLNTSDAAVNEYGKRNIHDVIDSSDDELFMIKGKPSRKKYRKEDMSDSFHEAFYLSSSDESIDTSSDEDIFASSADENGVTRNYPDDRQRRLMKRRMLQYYHLTSHQWV